MTLGREKDTLHGAGVGPSRAAFGIAAVAGALVMIAVAGDLRQHPGVASAAFLLALLGAWGVLQGTVAATAPRALLLALIGLRALALASGPSLSDDHHRYIHEGRAQRLGLAVPYETPPADITPPPDDGTTARVNHPEVPAAYPPGTELVLWVTTALGDRMGQPLLPLRLLLIGADLAVLGLLYRRRPHTPGAFAAYGVHPLPLLEIAVGAHLDGLGIAALLLATLSSRGLLQGALLGLAAHVKPVAVLGLLGVPRRALAAALVGFVLGTGALAVPHLLAGAPITRGLLEYATRWRAAPFAYALLEASVRAPFERRAAAGRYAHLHVTVAPPGLLVEDGGEAWVELGHARPAARPILLDAALLARLLAALALAVALVVIARSPCSKEARVGYALCAFWLLAPTVHPWYLVWLVPFAALSSSRALWAFSAASPLLYQPVFHLQPSGAWQEAVWPRELVLIALLAGALLDARDRRR